MAREIYLEGRRYWIVSEPHERGWRAWVLEVRPDDSGGDAIGVDAIAETRGSADEVAERKLRRLLQRPA